MTSTSNQSVSVVVITRNRPRDLEVCLASLVAQQHQNFELVVVDQSTDTASRELVSRLAEADPRIRYVRDTGKGAARARNVGTAATTGNIVFFTDDDCEAA